MKGTSLRQTSALIVALAMIATAAGHPGHVPSRSADPRPNIVVILTDDQSFDTLPTMPAAMPYLQSRIFDPADHWIWFPNAFISTPLCCPSRASILTGRYADDTGVVDNTSGHLFDASNTLATWLHGGGYYTGLVGKYLNEYPFGRGPFVPPGWDRWYAKENQVGITTYYDYGIVDQGVPLHVGEAPETYATDFLAAQAVRFVQMAPGDRPYFLYFAPSAPHDPRIPAPRDAGAFQGLSIPEPPSFEEPDVSDKPAWVQVLPQLDATQRAELQHVQIQERRTLLGADDAVRSILSAIAARGDLGHTVVFFLTDNGFSFGEHRWIGKTCPYEECIRTPFAVRVPWSQAHSVPDLVSNVDLAPTIADLAGVHPGLSPDGEDLVPLLDPRSTAPRQTRVGVFLEWTGLGAIPPWWAVRTNDFVFVEDTPDTVELYDLTGKVGPPDPFELQNRADDPRYAGVRAQLANLLQEFRQE